MVFAAVHNEHMRTASLTADRPQTLGEEIANAISHGLGFLLAVASLPILLWQAQRQGGGTLNLVAVSVFSGTMMLGFPEWIVYAFMVPPMVLTALIALHQALFGFAQDDAEDNEYAAPAVALHDQLSHEGQDRPAERQGHRHEADRPAAVSPEPVGRQGLRDPSPAGVHLSHP